jgi:hypothetical protein
MAYELADYYGGAKKRNLNPSKYQRCRANLYYRQPIELRKGKGAYARFRPADCDDLLLKNQPHPPRDRRPAIRRLGPRVPCDVGGRLRSVVELKAMAKARGIKGYSKMRKAELCAELNA